MRIENHAHKRAHVGRHSRALTSDAAQRRRVCVRAAQHRHAHTYNTYACLCALLAHVGARATQTELCGFLSWPSALLAVCHILDEYLWKKMRATWKPHQHLGCKTDCFASVFVSCNHETDVSFGSNAIAVVDSWNNCIPFLPSQCFRSCTNPNMLYYF